MRRTVSEVALILYARTGDARAVIDQLRETVITHLEERGVRQSSVLAVAPLPVVFAVEIAELAAISLGEADATGVAPRPRVTRWIERTKGIRKPPGEKDEA